MRVYDGEVESLSDAGGRGIGVRAFDDGRAGYAYGTDLGDEGVRAIAAAAVEAAAVADPDEFGGLPEHSGATPIDGPRLARRSRPGRPRRRSSWRSQIERAARARPGVTQVENAVYSDAAGSVALANSRGFTRRLRGDPGLGLRVRLRRRGRRPDDRARRRPRARPARRSTRTRSAPRPAIAPTPSSAPASRARRRCPVVLDAFVAASFAGFIGAMLSADAAQRGRSLFAGREGEEIAAPAFALVDDGTLPDGPASAPFDGEGSPTRRTPLIADGRLLTLLFDSRTARRAQRATTGNAGRGSYRSPPGVGTTNLVLEAGRRVARRAARTRRRGPVRDRRRGPAFGRQPGLRDASPWAPPDG